MTNDSLTYRDAGVDIDAGTDLIERIKPFAAATHRTGVLAGLGGFGGLFALPTGFSEPVLVAGTDGVGTKLKLALQLNRHDSIGIDLVAMCANDVLVTGAKPLFFLDYYATGRLDVEVATTVIAGIAAGCQQAGCALLGGETAEMPGMYSGDEYDLAGFCVGIVEKSALLTPDRVQSTDVLIAIAASGPHSNGYSLIRKILAVSGADLAQPCGETSLGDALIAPTRIYAQALLPLMRDGLIHAAAHITGGGITDNLPRVLPSHCQAVIQRSSWSLPPVFAWLQQQGRISDAELLRTFNCGAGMLLCVANTDVDVVCAQLAQAGEQAWVIGRLQPASDAAPQVIYCA
ncbi:phosphoribosylformylglycinamidine cyclo-ligase [Rhodoferax sp. 4810]|uniref:Phosphoribosylformylglycinamidine cyclo-ligase n=1 Tax=Thiospirillum jenense TaxID=1653858 RepID=A0A839H428_9GAMM|nr:phosphoribosylformylglycinamidine cyclo-ligase [Thiospirillum jenense]MBB1072997.1 phosphoribosylformylglycinamidine cyclo-ligase [Rhodoferax jenense]MBB1124945.1 phosphoribosylformylglycinamidine cyclo-ligase [Thiospirillum jenense]